mgnify:FL=1|tara:strand:+ start:4522 stop:5019 length:498 start_codon:yes stop_codon:yes gene_type:complete
MSSEQETKPTKDTQKEEQGKVIKMKPIEVKPQAEQLTADGQKILPYITLNIVPVAKPRMTQSDKWKKRPATTKYWQYKENLKLLCFICRWQPKEDLDIQFVIPMPISWSGKKKEKYDGQPHKQRPDLDNLVKAFKDALLIEDSHVHTYHNIKKVWGREGQIIVKR